MSFISSLGAWLRKISKSFMSATISGKTITLTRHNGDTVILTTQDTTYEQASQSSSGLMSAEDKAILDAIPSTYAVKYGSLTDNPIIRTSQSGREANIINIGSDLTNPDTSETFDLGWNYINRDGALLGLRSSSYSTEPGYFKLYARDEDKQSILQGTPNGELTWRGNQVITLVDTATTTQNGLMSTADKTAVDSIPSLGTYNHMFFSQTSGTYTAPRTGWYRITLKGGGGAGAFRNISNNSTGGGGGEGAMAIFYVTLIKNTSYVYTIGAGAQSGYAVDDGQGNISYVAPTDSGGTSIIINNSTFAVAGGQNAWTGVAVPQGGPGGYSFALPGVTAERIYGAPGSGGLFLPSGFETNVPGASGGGNGGARGYTQGGATLNGQFGGGGAGMAYRRTQQSIDFYRGGNGGDGYILIEYAG